MSRLKQLKEDLGDLRRTQNTLTNERASKFTDLRALGKKESLTDQEQTSYDQLKSAIDAIDAKMARNEDQVQMVKDQITNEKLHGDQNDERFQFSDTGTEPSPEEKEISGYRLTKAFREALEGKLTGLEAEMHQEAKTEAKDFGYSSQLTGNLHIPQKVMHARTEGSVLSQHQMQRFFNALTAGGGAPAGSEGGYTIQETVMSLIDILRAKLPFVDSAQGAGDGLGATFFSQLTGDLSFPKAQEDSSDPAVKTENAAADEQDPTFGQFKLSPRRLPTFAEVSRQLLIQSTVDVENWLRNYLMYKLAKSMNKDIITFLLDLSNAHAITLGTDGGAPDWPFLVKFETEVEDSDTMELEPRLGYLTNARVKGKLKRTRKGDADSGIYLWDRDNLVNNYPAMISSLVPKDLTKGTGTDLSAMIFANWSNLFLGQWGGIDTLVNPYSKDTEGLIRLNAWTFFDRAARQEEAFAISKEIITT